MLGGGNTFFALSNALLHAGYSEAESKDRKKHSTLCKACNCLPSKLKYLGPSIASLLNPILSSYELTPPKLAVSSEVQAGTDAHLGITINANNFFCFSCFAV